MYEALIFLLIWYSVSTALFQMIRSKIFISDCVVFFDTIATFVQTIAGWIISVSYTHLDVYKRQVVKDIKRNPKRMQRVAKKQTMETGIGTKSQQALKLQQEQNNQERKERSRKKKEAEEQRIFELKQQKKREKHKGH